MLKSFFSLFLSLLFLLFLFPLRVSADGEFSSDYDVSYDISEAGVTTVQEKIKLTNLTDKFFPSSFTLSVPGTEVSDIQASDSQGALVTESSNDSKNTKIVVKFTNQQLIGKDKQYNFILNFKDNSISKNSGKVWTVNIPKLSKTAEINHINLAMSVPSAFGDPDYISIKPARTAESGGRIILAFAPDIIFEKGISAIFGENQTYSFETLFNLKNDTIFPKLFSIPLGISSSTQKTFITSVDPRPENTEVNPEGVILGNFRIYPGQSLGVKVAGSAQTFLKPLYKPLLNNEEKEKYLKSTKLWEKNSPIIKAKLSEIFEGKDNLSTLDKASKIDKYVSNFLRFDFERINKGDFDRFGSLTALNNPEKALTAEYVDLEIALLRSAGIPARQAIGFSDPRPTRPFAFYNNNLHSWVEFYTDEDGWATADPAWSNTTGGGDFFNYNDLNHIVLTYAEDPQPQLPYSVKAFVSADEVKEMKVVDLDVKINPELLSGFNSKAVVRINNLGNSVFPASELKIDASKILLSEIGGEPSNSIIIKTPEIAPFGNLEYEFTVKTGAIWHSYQDALQVNFAGATDTRVITVNPLLSYKIYAVELIGGLIMIALFYVLVLLVHHKSSKKES